MRLPAFPLRASSLAATFRARPRFLAAWALVLVAGLSVLGPLVAPTVWSSSASGERGPEATTLYALRFEGDIVSGEAVDLVRALQRSFGRTERSFLETAPSFGPLLGQLPEGGQVGLVLVRVPASDLGVLDERAEAAARLFPGIRAAGTMPWDNDPQASLRVWYELLDARWFLLPATLILLFYPLLESFSRMAHLRRALLDTFAASAGITAGVILSVSAAGLAVAAGSGHSLLILLAAVLGGITGAVMPILWERHSAVAGEDLPALEAAARTLQLSSLAAAPLTAGGLLLALVPASPVFGSQMLQVFVTGLSLFVASVTSSSLRLLIRRPSTPRERAVSVLTEWALTLSPFLGRLVRRPALSLAAGVLVAAGLAVSPALILSDPGMVPAQVPARSPSVLIELSSRTGQVPVVAAADFLEAAEAETWLSSGRELFGAAPDGFSLVFSFETEAGLSPASLERRVASLEAADGLSVRAVGGSYRAWGEWSASLLLASGSALLLVLISFAASLALFGHTTFRFARAGVIPVAAAAAVFFAYAPVMLSGVGVPDSALAAVICGSAWSMIFAFEFARDCDAGGDGRSAAVAAWLAAIPLPLLLVPAALMFPDLRFSLPAAALLATMVMALPLASMVGPRLLLRV